MPVRMLGEALAVTCMNHPHSLGVHDPQKSTMFKYEDAFVLQAIERSDPPFALRKEALRVTAHVCRVCGYVELYAGDKHE